MKILIEAVIAGGALGVVFALGGLAGVQWEKDRMHRELIARGLAIYCPHNGEFAFVGEC